MLSQETLIDAGVQIKYNEEQEIDKNRNGIEDSKNNNINKHCFK